MSSTTPTLKPPDKDLTVLRQVSAAVASKLPRELRDHVYSYLWDDDVISSLNYNFRLEAKQTDCEFALQRRDAAEEPLGQAMRAAQKACSCEVQIETLPPLVLPAVVGSSFATEAVTWLYHNYEGFRMRPEDLVKFLDTDVLHVGVTPRNSKMRRLTLDVDLGSSSSGR